MKKVMVIVMMLVMVTLMGCVTYAQTKVYVVDEHRILIYDDEDDGVYIVLHPKRLEGDNVICRAEALCDGEWTFVENYPSKLGQIFELNNDGTLTIKGAEEGR